LWQPILHFADVIHLVVLADGPEKRLNHRVRKNFLSLPAEVVGCTQADSQNGHLERIDVGAVASLDDLRMFPAVHEALDPRWYQTAHGAAVEMTVSWYWFR
jgi:hypothetical protein